MRAFDALMIHTESAVVLGATLCDREPVSTFAPRVLVPVGVGATISLDNTGFLEGAGTRSVERRNQVDKRQRSRDVVGCRASENCDDWFVFCVCEDVTIGTRTRAIRSVQARFLAAPIARIGDESTAGYEKSIWALERNLSSSNSCCRFFTPPRCQSFSRRRQVACEQKPRRVGKWIQWMPAASANRMPLGIGRTGTGRAPRIALRAGHLEREQRLHPFVSTIRRQ